MRLTWLFFVSMGIILTLSGMAAKGSVIIQQLNSPGDLDLSGNIVYAVNFGNTGHPNVGGVVFSPDEDYPAITHDATGEGPATWWGPYPGTGDAGLNQLLGALAYKHTATLPMTFSISAGGLNIGKPYLLQTIVYEPETHSRNIDIIVEGIEIVTGFDPIIEQGGVVGQGGSVMKYEFIALDPTLNIRMISHYNAAGLSGFILTEIPEPASVSLLAFGAVALVRRKRENTVKKRVTIP